MGSCPFFIVCMMNIISRENPVSYYNDLGTSQLDGMMR